MTRMILDTDLAMGAPGSDIDDGFALAFALADPGIELELVTTVHGNTDVDTATALSHDLLARLGRPDIPVVKGSANPLRRSPHRPRPSTSTATAVPHRSRSHAANAIIDWVMSAPGEITICTIGPLTNLALALALEPGLAGAVKSVVSMGGMFLRQTNRTGRPGEFNIWADPEAAAMVLAGGLPLRLVGLDVTLKVRLTLAGADQLERGGRPFGAFAGACARAYIAHRDEGYPGDRAERGSCPMHDPLAVAAVVAPDLLTWAPAQVSVETASDLTRGVTVTDLLTSPDPPAANCEVATDVAADAFMGTFLTRISSL